MTVLEVAGADFAYGNARLRARRSSLLGRTELDALLLEDVDGILAALADTGYRADLEAVLPRARGVRRVHEAVRAHLGRSLEEMRRFYAGGARALVDAQLSRWDVRNLVALLRAQVAGVTADEAVGLLVPVGPLDEPTAREIARQEETAAAVQLLVAWRLPTPAAADALAAAWPAYERSEDLAALEHALVRAWSARTGAALAGAGGDAEPLRRVLRDLVDDRNLVTALRLREAAEAGEEGVAGADVLLAGGALERGALLAGSHAPTRADAAAALASIPGAARLVEPLRAWASGGDPAALEDALERERLRARLRLFSTGDPLSVAVPLAYEAAKEVEARNLRVLAEGAARDADPARTRALLVTP